MPTHAALVPEYHAFSADLRRERNSLSAALKRSVPFHSPRYLGHMVSDLLLPGLAAQILTLPYNPNNVSEDSAPCRPDRSQGAFEAGGDRGPGPSPCTVVHGQGHPRRNDVE